MNIKITFIIIVALLYSAIFTQAQNAELKWVKQFEGTGGRVYVKSIAVDASGNVYTTGYFNGTIDFDPGVSTFNLTSTGVGDNIFISKLDSSGNLVWAKQLGDTHVNSIAVDASGNVYTTGYFDGTIDFDPETSTFDLTSIGINDNFVCKLDANGDFIWAKQMGGTSNSCQGNSIAVDISGNIYTTGSFFGGTVDFDPGVTDYYLSAGGSAGIFISKLDANGNFVWAKHFESTSSYGSANSIAVDVFGNVYTTGYFRSAFNFDPGVTDYYLSAGGPNLYQNIFISKLDENGNFVWAKQLGDTSNCQGSSIVIDILGNVYTTGYFYGTADFDPGVGIFNMTSVGLTDIFVSKIDENGNFIWAKQLGGTGYDFGRSLSIDSSYFVYIACTYQDDQDDWDSDTINSFIYKMSQMTVNITATDSTVCEGDTVSFSALVSGGTGPYTYSWNNLNGDTTQVINELITCPEGCYDTYYVTVTDVFGTTAEGYIHITVNYSPYVFLDGSYPLCSGSEYTATVNAYNGASPYSYTWDVVGDTLENHISWRPLISTNYSVIVTDANFCTATASGYIDVSPTPIINLGNDTTICYGESIYLDAYQLGGSSDNYYWNTGSTDSGIYTDNYASNTYSVTVTDYSSQEYCQASDTITITINPEILVNLGIDTLICSGSTDTIKANVLGGTPPYTYSWGTYDRNMIGSSDTLIISPNTETYYFVTITDANNCTAVSYKYVDVPSVDITADDTLLCPYGSTYLYANTSGGGSVQATIFAPQNGGPSSFELLGMEGSSAMYTYNWSTGETDENIYVYPSGTSTYYVTVTEQNTGCTAIDSITIHMIQYFTANITGQNVICDGVSDTLTAIASGGVSPYYYIWSDDMYGQNVISYDSSVVVSPNDTTVYYVTITESSYCASMTYYSSIIVNVVPNNLTVMLGDPGTICSGASLYITPNVYGSTGSADYLWNTGASTASLNDNPTVSTMYSVQVTDSIGCLASDTLYASVSAPLVVTIGNDDTICSGSNIIIQPIVSGGTSPYSYQWSDNSTTQDINVTPTTTTNYYVIVSDPNSCGDTSLTKIITVNQSPTVSLGNDDTICNGNSITIKALVNGGTSPYSYAWSNNSYLDSVTVTPSQGAIYNVKVLDFNNCYASDTINISVAPIPNLYSVTGGGTNCSGGLPVNLSNSQTGVSYQLKNNGSNIGSPLNGTGSLLTWSNMAAGIYTVEATSINGCTSMMLGNATVTVLIVSNNTINGTQIICSGTSATVLNGSLPSGGNGIYTYQWQSSISSSTNGFNDISVATNQNYSPGVLTQDTWFRRIATSGSCGSDTSSSVLITVYPLLSNNTISSAQTICSGSTPSPLTGTTPSGGNGTYNYQWQSSITGPSTGFNNISGATGQNYTPGALTQTKWYRRMVSTGVCSSNTSPSIAVTVNLPVSNNTISSAQTICSGTSPATLNGSSPTGGNGTFTFQWQKSTLGSTTGFTNISGASNQSYLPGILTQNTWYRRVVISGVCVADSSSAILITISLPISNNIINNSDSICVGTAPSGFIGSTPIGGNNVYNYQWQKSTIDSTTGFTNIFGATSQNYSSGVLTQATWFRRIVNSGACLSNISGTIKIVIDQPIANNTVSGTQTICNGSSPSLVTGSLPTGGNGIYTYQWESSITDSISGFSSIIGASGQDYQPSNLIQTTWFRRIVVSGSCAISTSSAVAINVYPILSNNVISGQQTLCSGTTPSGFIATNPTGGIGSYTYQWQSSTISSSNGFSDISGATSLNYSSPSITQSTWFRRVVTSGACGSDTSLSIAITIDSLISNNIISSNQIICLGSTPASLTGTNPTGGNGTFNYQWQSSTISSITGFTDIIGEINSGYSPIAISQTTWYRRVISSGVCTSDTSATVEITVDQPIVNNIISAVQSICYGGTPNPLSGTIPTGGNGIFTYQWESSISGSTTGFTTILGATGDSLTLGALTDTIWYRRVVSSGVCLSDTSIAIQITIYPLPIVSFTGTLTAQCESSTTYLLTGGSPTGGTYSGIGVNAGNFDATIAGASGSPYTITYTYTDVNGCIDSTTNTIVVNPLPVVTFTGSLTTQCINSTTYLLTGGNPTGGTYSGIGVNAGNFDATLAGTSGSPYTITYTYSDVNGCADSATNTISVAGLPVTVVTNNGPICSGDTLKLYGNGGIDYSWSGPAGYTDTVQNPVILNATTAISGWYYVTVVDSLGCSKVDSTNVTINALPTVTFTGTLTSQCINFSAYTLTGGLPTGGTYSGTGVTGTNFDASAVGLAGSPYTITYIYQDANGCIDTATNTIAVNPLPVLTISNNSPVCSGDTLKLSANGGTTYAWDGPNGFTSNVQNPAIALATTLMIGNYTVTATDNNGCSDTLLTTTMINSLPTVTFIGTLIPQCASDTLYNITTNTVTSPSGGIFSGMGLTGTIFNASTVGSSGSPYTITYTYTDLNGCVNSATKQIIVNALPTVTFTGTLSPQCVNSTAYLLNGGSPVGGTYSGMGVNGSYFNASTVGTTGNPYSITYTYTDANGCIDTAMNYIQVNDLPLPNAGSNSPVCYGDTLKLSSGGGVSYFWDGPNGFVSTSQNPEIPDFISYNTYYVTVTDINGCTATDTVNATLQPLSSLTGMIKYSQGTINSANALVELYRDVNSLFQLYDTTSYLNGFTFSNLLPGNYLLRVLINDTNYKQLMPTYYDSAYTWQQADTLSIGCNSITNKIITMYEIVPQIGGIGEISGNIYFVDNTQNKATGEPVSGAEVFLEQEPDDEPISNTASNSTGHYEFDSIPVGYTYRLNVDIPGFPLMSTYNLHITTYDFSYKHIDFVVDTTDTGIWRSGGNGIDMINFSDFKANIYPNPFKEYLNINYILNETSDVNIEVLDALGRKIETIVNGVQKDGEYSYKFNSQKEGSKPGIYIIKFIVNNTVYLKKIVESK